MRKFIFRDQTTHEKLSVTVPEVLDGSYGMHVWPCAPVLAQYIWYNRNVLKGKYVLEIGAGTALPGVMAGLCGANIILSDSVSLPKCLENCQQTCKANGLQNIPILGITWGCFDPHLLRLGKVDIILGSDCFYNTKDFEDVIMTVSFILERNKDAEFWSTYQERRYYAVNGLIHSYNVVPDFSTSEHFMKKDNEVEVVLMGTVVKI